MFPEFYQTLAFLFHENHGLCFGPACLPFHLFLCVQKPARLLNRRQSYDAEQTEVALRSHRTEAPTLPPNLTFRLEVSFDLSSISSSFSITV